MQKKFNLFGIIILFCLQLNAQDWTLKLSSNVEIRSWKLTTTYEKEEKSLQGASIVLTKGGQTVSQTTSDNNGDFSIQVPPNDEFLMTVSYPGYNTKRFSVNTKGVPPEFAKDNYKPTFSIGGFIMAKAFPGIDYSGLQQPLVLVQFMAKRKVFDHDDAVTTQGLNIVSKIAGDENTLIQKFCSTNKAGDVALSKPDCPLAKTLYQNAMALIPFEAYPIEQLKKVGECLKNKNEAEAKAAADKIAAEAAAKAKAEADKIAADKAAADKLAADAAAKAKAEADRNAAANQQAEKEKASKAKALEEKLAKEKAEADKLAKQKEGLAKSKAEDEAAAKADEDKRKEKEAKQKEALATAKAAEEAEAKAAAEKKKEKDAKEKEAQANAKVAYEAEAKAAAEKKREKEAKQKEGLAKAKEEDAAEARAAEEKRRAKEEQAKKAKYETQSTDVAGEQDKRNSKISVPQVLGGDKYKENIKKADDYFKMKRWSEAKPAYEEALKYKADDPYAKSKLEIVNKNLSVPK